MSQQPVPSAALLDRIRGSVIGDGRLMPGPFGPRPLVYADHTASGRSLSFIEDFLPPSTDWESVRGERGSRRA